MVPYKHWKIRSKILFAAVVPFVMAVVISLPFLTNKSIQNIEEKAKAYIEETAYSNSIKIESDVENISSQVKVLSQALEAMVASGKAERSEVINILKNIALKNPKIIGIWTVWEKDKLDGKDAEFANKDGHNAAGSFMPYWSRENGELKLHTSDSYNLESLQRSITLCKDAQKEVLLEPYQATVGGQSLTLATLAYPIYDKQNKFVASVGVDFDLSDFQKLIKEVTPFDVGYAAIIDESGKYIASFNPQDIGTPIDEKKYNWQQIKPVLATGEYFVSDIHDPDLKQKIHRVVAPIKIGELNASWGLMVSLPMEPIFKDVNESLFALLVVVVVCLSLGISVSLVTARNIASPITQISTALEKISSGQTSAMIPEIDSQDEIGMMASSAHIFKENSVELINAKERAESANIAKTEFLSNMSHELRTPMHAMLSYSKMGLEKIEDKESKPFRYFQNIHNSGERLLRLVNNLLDLSKLEAGKIEFNFAMNDVAKCIQQVHSEIQALLSEKGLSIQYFNQLKDTNLVFDYSTMVQVLINIISNAIKFSPNNKSIFFSAIETKINYKGQTYPAVQFEIQDQGVGIPEEELALIFDKFTQSSVTNKGSGGTGLGLSIAQSIIMAHKGRIWAENAPDQGAVIKILIPRDLNNLTEVKQ